MTINLLLTADAGFAPGLGLTLASLLAHATVGSTYRIHLLDSGIADETWQALERRLRRHAAVGECVRLHPIPDCWPAMHWPEPRRREPYRWIEALLQLQHLDRLIYLDSDLLVTENLAGLWSVQLHGHVLAAVPDVTREIRFDCPDPRLRESPAGRKTYFNTGVLLIDLDAWRRKAMHEKCLEFLRRWEPECRYWDQTVVNAVLQGQFESLNWTWNLSHEALGYLEPGESDRLQREGFIWHLWRQYKPWLGFNYMESGALWYGLYEAWHGRQESRYHTTRPGYQQMIMRMRHPRASSLYHRLRGHKEMADFWSQRADAGTGKGNWAARFDARVDETAQWWKERLGKLTTES